MQKKTLILFAAILVFHLANNVYWSGQNTANYYDESVHYMLSAEEYGNILEPETLHDAEHLYPILEYSKGLYPPFFHLMNTAAFIFMGITKQSILAINTIFLAILVISTFLIGKEVYDEKTGLIAAGVVSFFPAIFLLSRLYLLDLALTAMVTASLFTLLKTKSFTDRKMSALAGITFGLGMLTKITFIIFLIVPLCIILKQTAAKINETQKKNILLFSALAITLFFLWYFSHAESLIDNIGIQNKIGIFEGNPAWNTPDGAMFYILGTINAISAPIAIILAAGALLFAKSGKHKKELAFFGFFILVPFIVFTFISIKEIRHFVPLSGVFAILAGKAIIGIQNLQIKKLVLGALAAILIVQFFVISYPEISDFSPKTGDWQEHNIISEIKNSKTEKPPIIVAENESPFFNSATLAKTAFIEKTGIGVLKLFDGHLNQKYILQSDIAKLEKTHEIFYVKILSPNADTEENARIYPLPNGDKVTVYKNRKL